MKKIILGVILAFLSAISAIVSFVLFIALNEPVMAILAVLFGFFALLFASYAIEETKLADKLGNLFAGEEVSYE